MWLVHPAAPDGLQADRSESVRRAAGQYVHILVDRQGRPLRLRMTGGPRHDRTQAQALVEVWTVAPLSCLIRGPGRAYAGDAWRA